MERAGASQKERERERDAMRKFACKGEALSVLDFDVSEWGPDLLINAFACNFADAPNDSLRLANELNAMIFNLCSVTDPRDYRNNAELELIITASQFDPAVYGRPFVDDFCRRLGVTPAPGEKVDFLICTSMDPWRTDAGTAGDFLATLEEAFCRAARRAMNEVRSKAHGTR